MKKKNPLNTADILLPKKNFEKWSVIACDQFTSDRKYWDEVKSYVGNENSTYKITFPEIYLSDGDAEERIENINREMNKYLSEDCLDEYKDALIYVERIQPDGRMRPGIIGSLDLEEYDFREGSKTPIRATEKTVIERLPPRIKIRKDAPLELPHILILIDDFDCRVIEPLGDQKDKMKKLYDFDLMMGGGHVTGYLIDDGNKKRIFEILDEMYAREESPLLYAVGDGNHSLATAKECYESIKKEDPDRCKDSPARYALAEIGNIHSDALDFEPIYRVMFSVDPEDVLNELRKCFAADKKNTRFTYIYGEKEGSVDAYIPSDKLNTGVLQDFIDEYIKKNPGAKVDYIHGIEDVRALSKEKNSIGFLFDGISKENLFESVKKTGVLPRKTFSMGEARSKRYYLECKRIK